MKDLHRPLSDFCQITQGGRHGLSGNDFVEDGYPAYGAGGMNGLLPNYEFDESAVVLSSIGARCGKCFFVEGKWSSLANTQVIRPDPELADAKFLWFQLNDEKRWPRSGTGQPFIKPSDVKNHRTYLPPLPEQRRIAAILDKAEALRTKRREALAQLDRLAQSIFVEMFGDPEQHIRNGEVKELAQVVAPDRIVTYGIVQAGPEVADGVPYIKTGDIKGGEILEHQLARTSREIADSYSRSMISRGDIVMSIRATVGTTALVPPSLDGANLTQGTARISPGSSVLSAYMLSYLRTESIQRWIQAQVKGATFREITLGKLRQLPVHVPLLSLQKEFERRISQVAKLRDLQELGLRKQNHLFDSLQHRAFRGEL